MNRSYRLFPLSLIILLGFLTFFLDQVTQLDMTEKKLDPDKPEYTISKLTATRFDLQGNIQERLTADLMWQYPKNDDRFFLQPLAHTYKSGVLQYWVDAERGQYDNKKKLAYFSNKVTLHTPANEKRPPSRVDTTQMWVDTEKQIANSNQPVTFQYGTSHGSAVGFKYDRKAQQLYLLSKIKATYVTQ